MRLHAVVSMLVGGPGPVGRPTGAGNADDRDQLGHAGVDHGFGFGSVSALSASISKSACAFPWMSITSLARAGPPRAD